MGNNIFVDIKTARLLKAAGFDKKCVHQLSFLEDDTDEEGKELYAIIAYNTVLEHFVFDKTVEMPNSLMLPTLGEIELPEEMIIYQRNDLYYVGFLNGSVLTKYSFVGSKTEIKARAWAWIYHQQIKNK